MAAEFNGFILVKFLGNNKEYSFGTNDDSFLIDHKVVVETARGLELAQVSKRYQSIDQLTHGLELKPVIRLANDGDIVRHRKNKLLAFDAKAPIEKAIRKHKLDMNLMDVEYTLDQKKLIITYVADARVDFRELLKDLSSMFNCRIELKQINPREKAKLVGGLGVCGRELCCKGHLKCFDSISINMAKDQNMSLNTNRLTGQCGKLKCCLKYEHEQYKEASEGLPKLNSKVNFNNKKYKVADLNLLSKQITLANNEERLVMSIEEYQQNA